MSNATEDLQAAADRGELQARTSTALKKQTDAAERRWIVAQAVEIAKASPLSPDEFRTLCNFMREFIQPADEQKIPGTPS